MKEAYWRWYKWQGFKVKVKVEIEIEDEGMQWLEGLLHLIRKLELDK